jgi:hypothetical protein
MAPRTQPVGGAPAGGTSAVISGAERIGDWLVVMACPWVLDGLPALFRQVRRCSGGYLRTAAVFKPPTACMQRRFRGRRPPRVPWLMAK